MTLAQIVIGLAVVFGLWKVLKSQSSEGSFTKIKNSNFAPSIKKTFSEDLTNKKDGFEKLL